MSHPRETGRNPRARRTRSRENHSYTGEDETVVPLARYADNVGLRLTPSQDLNDLLGEFLTPVARAKLGRRALMLSSQRYVSLPLNDIGLQDQLVQYEQGLHEEPVIPEQHFRIEKKFASHDDVDRQKFSIVFKVGISATFYSRIFAEPFFAEDEADDHLVVGHVFSYSELVDAHNLEAVWSETTRALKAHHPTATRKFAPHYFSVTKLRTEQRKLQ